MTPKEKAEELYGKMLPKDITTHPRILAYAKQCALIAVDEILGSSLMPNSIKPYWEEVKNEIELL